MRSTGYLFILGIVIIFSSLNFSWNGLEKSEHELYKEGYFHNRSDLPGLHFAYDTYAVFGNALSDENFNTNGTQGMGSGVAHYSIPKNGNSGSLEVHSNIKYQAISKRFVDDMFTYSNEEIDLFQYLFKGADQEPVTVGSDILITDPLSIDEFSE